MRGYWRKFRKKPNRKARKDRPHRGQNRHHLTPKSVGGRNDNENILWIDIERHSLWHKLWGNRTLEQIIALLQRLARMKHRTHRRYHDEEAA